MNAIVDPRFFKFKSTIIYTEKEKWLTFKEFYDEVCRIQRDSDLSFIPPDFGLNILLILNKTIRVKDFFEYVLNVSTVMVRVMDADGKELSFREAFGKGQFEN